MYHYVYTNKEKNNMEKGNITPDSMHLKLCEKDTTLHLVLFYMNFHVKSYQHANNLINIIHHIICDNL